MKAGRSLEEAMTREVPTVSPDTQLSDLFELVGQTPIPAAVVDEKRKLAGIIVRGSVLAALAGSGQQEEGEAR